VTLNLETKVTSIELEVQIAHHTSKG